MRNLIISGVMLLFLASYIHSNKEQEAICLKETVSPTHKYEAGEKVVYKPTGEVVRITTVWELVTLDVCERKGYGEYTIHFQDGAKIDTTWQKLYKYTGN